MHPATTLLHTTTAHLSSLFSPLYIGRNANPSTSNTTLCPERNMVTNTREMVDRLVPLQDMDKASRSPLGATNREGSPTIRERTTVDFPCNLPTPPPSNRVTYNTAAVVSWCHDVITPPSPFNTQIGDDVIVSRPYPHIYFFYARKSPQANGLRVEHQPQVFR